MDTHAAAKMARNVMRLHGVSDTVALGWSRSTKIAGETRFENGRPVALNLATPYVKRSDKPSVRDTVRHEVAHIIAGIGAGHGPAWVAACKKTGAVATTCHNPALVATRTRRNREHYARQAAK